MQSPIVASLAILMVNWDENKKDYLHNFANMLAEIIRVSPDEVLSLPELSTKFDTRFGFLLPQNVMKRLLKRLERQGYISRRTDNTYTPNRKKLSKLNFDVVQQDVIRKYDNLIASLREFCRTTYELEWTIDEAEAALQNYLSENQIILLTATTQRQATLIPLANYPVESAKYIVAQFIKHVVDVAASEFDYLDTIVKGNMLANAMFLPTDQANIEKRWTTQVYFDTTFLIEALGYTNHTNQELRKELLAALYQTGAGLRCFQHTLEEIRGSLHAAHKLLIEGRVRDAYGPLQDTLDYFLDSRYTPSDVLLVIGSLEQDLEMLRITVVDKPEYVHKHVIDEAALQECLAKFMVHTNPTALKNDVDSLSAIVRLRHGQRCYHIENCQAIFITTNPSLVRGAREFFCEEDHELAKCINDYTLTNLLWLRQPTEAPNLSRKKIIADSYAAMQPDAHLWSVYVSRIDKLQERGDISSEAYYAYRYNQGAKAALMEVTRGEVEALTDGSIAEILNRAERNFQSRRQAELETAQNHLQSELQTVQTQLHEETAREQRRRANIALRAQRWARNIIALPKIGLFLLWVVFVVISLPLNLLSFQIPSPSELGMTLFVLLVFVCGVFLSLMSMTSGNLLERMFRRWEIELSNRIEKVLKQIASVD